MLYTHCSILLVLSFAGTSGGTASLFLCSGFINAFSIKQTNKIKTKKKDEFYKLSVPLTSGVLLVPS